MTAAVDILILGAGWTADFLIPLLQRSEPKITFAATTRDGRVVQEYRTIALAVNGTTDWNVVPKARTIILTFPTTEKGAVTTYVEEYEKVHGTGGRWVQLGSTSAWDKAAEAISGSWITRNTEIPRPAVPRVESEFELLDLTSSSSGRETSVLNLSGLWGGSRSARNWVVRIGATKEALAAKGALHMIHGTDVARAILAVHEKFTPGERWLLTDTRVYDWWDLASAWGSSGQDGQGERGSQSQWVLELMREHKVSALPRGHMELPGKHLSSTDFWQHFEITPARARLEE